MNILKISRKQFFEMEELRKLSNLENTLLCSCNKCNEFRFTNVRFCDCGGRYRIVNKVEIVDFQTK